MSISLERNESGVVEPNGRCGRVPQEVEDQHCADLDVGVDCTVEQSRRVATIKRSVCDQQRQQQYCHQVP